MNVRDPTLMIVGSGAMAHELKGLCAQESITLSNFPWKGGPLPDVAVHVGSGREFVDLVQFCSSPWRTKGVPVLQCSSGIEPYKTQVHTPVFDIPNAALPSMLFLEFVNQLSRHVLVRDLGSNWKLEESHQQSKEKTSSTAEVIAKHMQIPFEQIAKDRSRPEPHAYHHLYGSAAGVEMDFSLKVEGRRPYAEGMLYLARRAYRLSDRLERRWYEAEELLRLQ